MSILMKLHYILSIIIFAGILGILPSLCEVWGLSEQNDTYISNKSNSNDLNYIDIEKLMDASSSADPEAAWKGWGKP